MKYIAFLRAINVAGRNVKMEKLREMFVELGLLNVETFIASGNVIFETQSTDIDGFEQKIEKHLLHSMGYEVGAFIRTNTELNDIADYQPFKPAELQSAAALNVAFIKEPMTAAMKTALSSFNTEIDSFHAHGREVYWLCKTKQSDSKFSGSALEKKLKIATTFRGINTITRLANKYSV